MPRVKTESRIKNQESRVKSTSVSSRAKRGDLPRKKKIAASVATLLPRNDKTETTRSTRGTSLSVPVYSLAGRASGTLSLPKEIFGVKVNKNLLLQTVRVYSTNQKMLLGNTKTRGEVEGSTVKIYRQKGTGRARHGGIRAPIFVGGGIVFGPKSRKVRLDLPKQMRKTALISALSSKAAAKNIIGISGLEKASGKTREMARLLKQLNSKLKTQNSKLGSALIVTGEKQDNVVRAVRNIPGVAILPVNLINAYEVLKHQMLLVTKEAVNVIPGRSAMTTPESDSGRSASLPVRQAGRRIARMTIKKDLR